VIRDDSSRQAGAEIEITEDMLRCGSEVLGRFWDGPDWERLRATRILLEETLALVPPKLGARA